MNTMETVKRFFERAPQFTQLGKAMADFSRSDFHQPLQPANFLSFVQRDAGDLDEESVLEYCRLHLDRAGLWNLGLELEVRTCWRMADVLDYWRGLIQGGSRPSLPTQETA
jgi:hypothetical protein